MASITFRLPFVPVLDEDGQTVSGAKLYFYLTQTLTLTPVYSDSDLSTELTNPVICNSAGQPPAIYLDSSITYRVRIHDAEDVFLYEVDPYQSYDAEEILTALLSVDGINSGLDADKVRGTTPTGSGLALLAGTVSQLGLSDSNITLTPSDAGRVVRNISSVSRTATIQRESTAAWASGAFMICGTLGSGSLVIARDTGVSLTYAGTDKNVTIAAGGIGFLVRQSADQWFIFGSGLS